MVVSEEIETHRRLFPQTAVRWHDTDRAVALTARLLDDPAFRTEVVATAAREVDYYSVDICRARLAAGTREAIVRFRRRPEDALGNLKL